MRAAWAFWLLAVGGCASPTPRPPVTLRELVEYNSSASKDFTPRAVALYNTRRVVSKSLSEDQRLESLRVLEAVGVGMEEACPALVLVLADAQTPRRLRHAVLALLARRRQPGLARPLMSALPAVTDPALRLSMLGWLEENPSGLELADVVKLWAARPELPEAEEARYRRIVEKLTGKDWRQALLEGLNAREFYARGSAIELLSRRVPSAVLRRSISALKARTDAVRAMQLFVEAFGYVPANGRELLATVVAYADGDGRFIRAAGLANYWRSQYGYRFNIRDLHLLEHLAGDPVRNARMSRAQLVLEVARAIARRRAGLGGSRPAKIRAGRVVDFQANSDGLSMADLWNLLLLDEMFRRPTIAQAFRLTAAAGRSGPAGAWGGLICWSHGQFEARAYRPGQQGGKRYVPSERMLWDALRAACFFVGHLRGPRGEVGPTADELALARRLNLYGVAVTGLGTDRLNVMYFTPAGTVVDLGEFPTR